jgi:hypothetical protein
MSTKLAVKDESLPFLLFDKLDDDLIKQELEGKIPNILTYHFTQGGKEVWGISKPGVDECVRQLARKGEVIREINLTFTETQTDFLFTGTSARYAVNADGKEVQLDTRIGLKRQPKFYNNGQPNQFAFEQGGMKALRNANRRLIPPEIEAGVIEYAKQHGKVKEVKHDNGEAPQPEPKKKDLRKDLGALIMTMANNNKDKAMEYLWNLSEHSYRSMKHVPDDAIEGLYNLAVKDFEEASELTNGEDIKEEDFE